MINNQKGGASIVAVTLTTVLISVLTVATMKLMTGEVRQSIDGESGIKAYYLTESSIEESIGAIRAAIEDGVDLDSINQNNCNEDRVSSLFQGAPIAPSGGITCRKILTSTTMVSTDKLLKSGVRHYDLSRNIFNKIELAWDQFDTFANSDFDANPDDTPPIMEVTRIEYTDSDPGPATQVDPASISVKSLLLTPSMTNYGARVPAGDLDCGTIANQVIDYNACQNQVNPTDPNGGSVNVQCVSPGKRCKAVITNFIPPVAVGDPQKKVVLRLRPYNKDAVYDMALFQGTNPITIRLDAISIDITARVGDSFRRVQDEFDVTANPGPLDAIFGDESVCKDFRVKSLSPTGEDPSDAVEIDECTL